MRDIKIMPWDKPCDRYHEIKLGEVPACSNCRYSGITLQGKNSEQWICCIDIKL